MKNSAFLDSFGFNLALVIGGVLIAAMSQILLKKAAVKPYDKWYKQYLNVRVIVAYAAFVLSSLLSVLALRILPLSLMPLWNSASYVFVTLFAYLFMKERPGRRKLVGLAVILFGIVVFSL